MGPLPKSKGYDYLLVVIDKFTLQVHLLPTTTHATAKAVAWLFFTEIIRLHGMPESIVSNQDPKFTSKFWKELHRLMGMKLLMSTSFHPQMDGATEWANRSISQVLQALVRNSQNDWTEHCPMVEFTLNSSVHASTGYVPFELNYGYIPRLGQRLNTDTKFVGVCQFMEQALWNVTAAHDAIIAAHVMQTHHINRHWKTGDAFAPGDKVYLLTKNLEPPKGRAKKLLPKFIGLYKVVKAHTTASMVTFELPPELTARWVHPTFHASLLRAHVPNDDARFCHHDMKACYDFGAADEPEWFVDEILAHR